MDDALLTWFDFSFVMPGYRAQSCLQSCGVGRARHEVAGGGGFGCATGMEERARGGRDKANSRASSRGLSYALSLPAAIWEPGEEGGVFSSNQMNLCSANEKRVSVGIAFKV